MKVCLPDNNILLALTAKLFLLLNTIIIQLPLNILVGCRSLHSNVVSNLSSDYVAGLVEGYRRINLHPYINYPPSQFIPALHARVGADYTYYKLICYDLLSNYMQM